MKAFEKARTEWLDQKPDKAQKDLGKAVQVYPQFAEAWYQLGKIQEASKSRDAASSFSKSIAADPNFILPYEHLAPIAAQAGKWQDDRRLLPRTRWSSIPRGSPQTWYYNALGEFQAGQGGCRRSQRH